MKKIDLKSSKLHDLGYKNEFELNKSIKRIEEYNEIDLYSVNGFREIIEGINGSIDTHIDVGCGTGWLMIKTSPYFKRVVGIDPSDTAINIARTITKDIKNLEFVNSDMVEGIRSIGIREPVFITTGVVFSHIKDYHVKAFLKELNTIPHDSVIYFDEPYGKNIQQNMWHVRSKKWWADNLPEWDITFRVRDGSVYSGIYGKKVGQKNRKLLYTMSVKDTVLWTIDGIKNKILRFLRAIKRIVKRIKS